MISSVPFFGSRAAREERVPHAGRCGRAGRRRDSARRTGRRSASAMIGQALRPARRVVAPAGRHVGPVSAATGDDARLRRRPDGKAEDQRADQRVVEVGGRRSAPRTGTARPSPRRRCAAHSPARPAQPPRQRQRREDDSAAPSIRSLAPAQRGSRTSISGGWVRSQVPSADVDEMRPAVARCCVAESGLMARAQFLRVLAQLARPRVIHAGGVSGWPRTSRRIVLQRLRPSSAARPQPMARLPAEQSPGAADVERVVIVGHRDHERLMNGFSPWSIASGTTGSSFSCAQRAGRGDRLGHAQRRSTPSSPWIRRPSSSCSAS